MRQAVIDLGTNTHHLIIVDRGSNDSWTPVLQHRIYVKMGEDGLQFLGQAPMERSLAALKLFKTQIDAAGVEPYQVRAFGTAWLRMASNGAQHCAQIEEATGIRVELISGDEEAAAIFRGVRAAVPFPEGDLLIMDIGGGSVEFIIANREKVHWQKSFEIGGSILYHNFHKSDPIAEDEIRAIRDFLDLMLKPLQVALSEFPCKILIGASGAFDCIDLFILDPVRKPKLYGNIKRVMFEPLYEKFVKSSISDRLTWEKLPLERVEMIVVAHVLIDHILEMANIKEIYTSEYALKEGMLVSM